jgi:hypothetical protein
VSSGGARVWCMLLMVVWWIEPQNHEVTVSRVWLQNSGGGFEEERMARGGIEDFVSRRSYLMKGALAIRRRLS